MRKLSVDGKPINIEPYMEDLTSCFRVTRGLIAVYLYGSYGTPHQTPLSDVDLGLVFRLDSVPAFREEIEIVGRIAETARDDDVTATILNRAAAPFQFRVLSTGRLIYCADRLALADFVEQVINDYGDFVIDYEGFIKEYDAALVERYGR